VFSYFKWAYISNPKDIVSSQVEQRVFQMLFYQFQLAWNHNATSLSMYDNTRVFDAAQITLINVWDVGETNFVELTIFIAACSTSLVQLKRYSLWRMCATQLCST